MGQQTPKLEVYCNSFCSLSVCKIISSTQSVPAGQRAVAQHETLTADYPNSNTVTSLSRKTEIPPLSTHPQWHLGDMEFILSWQYQYLITIFLLPLKDNISISSSLLALFLAFLLSFFLFSFFLFHRLIQAPNNSKWKATQWKTKPFVNF